MLILFFSISMLILLSTIGYGLITIKILKFEKFSHNYGLIGILGLFFLTIVAGITHLFVPHNYLHNIIVLIIGLVGLIFLKKKKFNELKFLIIIFLLLFIAILMAKTNEDFGYYHLPNSLQFAQQKIQFGLGNLNHGFKHISSIFMLMSLHYLPAFEYNLFNLTNFLFFTFFITFILNEIYLRNKINLNFSNIVLSLFFILFLTKFSRLAEYGSDISGQILISIYFFYQLEFFYNSKLKINEKFDYFKLSLILIVFAVTLKFISIIYSFLLIVFFVVFKKKRELIIQLFKFNYLLIIALPVLIFFILNFSSTGCLIYPIEYLCLTEKLDWTLNSEIIQYLNFHYEVWAKGGKGPDFSVNNQADYILHLNWLSNWIDVYFIGKFSDYILAIIAIILIFTLFYYHEIFLLKNKLVKIKYNFLLVYSSLIIIFLFWFFNFPTLRYAGYIIVFLLLIFPYSHIVENQINLRSKKVLKKLSIIFLISYSIFLIKNLNRISNELDLSANEHNNFENFPFYWVNKKDYEKIKVNGHQLYLTEGSCWAVPSTCVRGLNTFEIVKKNSYIFYKKK